VIFDEYSTLACLDDTLYSYYFPSQHKEELNNYFIIYISLVFRGIVPITCDELFKTIAANKDANKVRHTTVILTE